MLPDGHGVQKQLHVGGPLGTASALFHQSELSIAWWGQLSANENSRLHTSQQITAAPQQEGK
jgi:hypothetical protein